MRKVKEEIEKIASELISSDFSVNVLEEDLPERAIFQPSHVYTPSKFSSSIRPLTRYSIEEDMLYIYEVFRSSSVFKVNKDFSIEIYNLREIFDNSFEKRFIWNLKGSGKFYTRNIADVIVRKDGSYNIDPYYEFAFPDRDALKEKLSSQNGKIVVYLQRAFLLEVPELSNLVNEINFNFSVVRLSFGKISLVEISKSPTFCYLNFKKPVVEIKVSKNRRR